MYPYPQYDAPTVSKEKVVKTTEDLRAAQAFQGGVGGYDDYSRGMTPEQADTVSYLKTRHYQVLGTMADGSVKMQYNNWFKLELYYVHRDGRWVAA